MRMKGEELDLKVERYRTSIAYTAISHVWPDGLGNPYENSIPRCQLLRLREMIHETYSLEKFSPLSSSKSSWKRRILVWLYWYYWKSSRAGRPVAALDNKRIYFWIDILCIPISQKLPTSSERNEGLWEFDGSSEAGQREIAIKEERHFKMKMLNMITQIFAGAYTVLILDQTLDNIFPRGADVFQGAFFAALVLRSTWAQRGWTLQEGAMAQTCVFRVGGKPYEMSTALRTGMKVPKWQDSPLNEADTHARDHIALLLGQMMFNEKRRLTADSKPDRFRVLNAFLNVPHFVRIWNMLLQRSTTKSEDGVVILANLLDFNVHSFSRRNIISAADRLVSLIQSCKELPLSILYNTGPRLYLKNHPEVS